MGEALMVAVGLAAVVGIWLLLDWWERKDRR
jgi:hypothetical protein